MQAAYVDVSRSAFHESGGISALTGFNVTDGMPYSVAGLRMNAQLAQVRKFNWQARALVGWQHAYNSAYPVSPFAFAGGASFLITGAPVAKNSALIDAAIDVSAYHDTLHVLLGYIGQISGRVQDNGIQLTLNYRFA